jgi:hypothetical protein
MIALWPWITLALLGAYHGMNPGMGWLFAVSLGLQERRRAAVLRAFAPIAIGHFVSIAAVVALVAALRFSVAPEILRYTGAGVLIAFGIYKLVAPMSHPRWVGMRIGARQLALWSFLMATAHGAGLMVVPVVLKMSAKPAAGPSCHAQIGRMAGSGGSGMLAAMTGVGLHTLAMFLAMATIALLVYDRIGLKILRTAWVNLDLVWAAALVGAGILTLVM